MKKYYFLLIGFFLFQFLQAQDQNSVPDEPVFEIKDVDVQPNFSGGLDVFYSFFDSKFRKPSVPQLVGKIFISFVVEKDGTLTDIQAIKDPGFGTGVEAEKVLQESPKWIPGRKDGKAVRVKYILPIAIHTE